MKHRLAEGIVHVLGLDIVKREEFVCLLGIVLLDSLPQLFVHAIYCCKVGLVFVFDYFVSSPAVICLYFQILLNFDSGILHHLIVVRTSSSHQCFLIYV